MDAPTPANTPQAIKTHDATKSETTVNFIQELNPYITHKTHGAFLSWHINKSQGIEEMEKYPKSRDEWASRILAKLSIYIADSEKPKFIAMIKTQNHEACVQGLVARTGFLPFMKIFENTRSMSMRVDSLIAALFMVSFIP